MKPSGRRTLNAGSFEGQEFQEKPFNLSLQTENNILDISSNLGEFWMEDGTVIPEYR